MDGFICMTCGVQHAPSEAPPRQCAICEDPRQYVPESGQAWTTMAELRAERSNEIRDDAGVTGIGTTPWFAIGQRALLVPWGDTNLLWDCVTLLDDATAEEVERRGGLGAIAISHPHYYSAMVEWAHRFDCPVLLHAADAPWVMRPDPAIEFWDGETRDLGRGLTLIRAGGHFPGATVLHHRDGAGGAGALLSGDVVQVIPDRSHVAFMWSYPNLVPLPGGVVRDIGAALEPFAFETVHAAWWGTVVRRDAKGAVRRSVERYGQALRGELG